MRQRAKNGLPAGVLNHLRSRYGDDINDQMEIIERVVNGAARRGANPSNLYAAIGFAVHLLQLGPLAKKSFNELRIAFQFREKCLQETHAMRRKLDGYRQRYRPDCDEQWTVLHAADAFITALTEDLNPYPPDVMLENPNLGAFFTSPRKAGRPQAHDRFLDRALRQNGVPTDDRKDVRDALGFLPTQRANKT